MAFDTTITERDLDGPAKELVQGFQADYDDFEPDLSVDGLSDSVLSRFLGFFGLGGTRR